jgi:hypothetical protein
VKILHKESRLVQYLHQQLLANEKWRYQSSLHEYRLMPNAPKS